VKRKFIFPAAMCLSAAILFSSIPASTDSGYAVYAAEKELSSETSKSLENQITSIEQELAALERNISSAKTDLSSELAAKADLDEKVELVGESIVAAEKLITTYAGDIEKKQAEIDAKLRSIEDKYDEFEQWLLMSYENDQENYLAMMLSADNLVDFLSAAEGIANIISYQNTLMDELDGELAALEAEKEVLEGLHNSQTQALEKLEIQKENYEDLVRSSQENINKQQSSIAAMQKTYKESQTQLDKVNAELEAELERLAQQNTVFIGGEFAWPVERKYTRISSPYGWRKWPAVEFHRGIDIPGAAGSDIYASLGGTVVTAQYHYSYGNYVVIDHGGGRATLYAHATKLMVSVGDKVNQGDVIATIGNTGYSFGAHLHFEVRIDGKTVNPEEYVPVPN